MNHSNFTNRIVILLITGLLFSGTTTFSQTQIAGYTFMGVYNSHYYYISTCGMSWTTANTAAEEVGGYLAAISSLAENEFICGYLNYQFIEGVVWIGLYDPSGTDVFEWSNGEPVIYTNYIIGEEDYVAAWEYPAAWFAAPESEQFLSILEFDGTNNDCLGSDWVHICHNGNVICVSQSAVEAHLNHGDYLGPCSGCDAPSNDMMGGSNETEDPSMNTMHHHIHAQDLSYEDDMLGERDFTIYPNPVKDVIYISLPVSDGISTIDLYDYLGRLFWKDELKPGVNTATIPIDDSWNDGAYYIRVQQEDKEFTSKLMIVK